MARISGVDLPRDKRVEIGLTYVYGIGLTSSQRILKEANVNPDTRCKDLTDEEVKKIVDRAYNRAVEILSAHADKLHAVAGVLLEKEKINQKKNVR